MCDHTPQHSPTPVEKQCTRCKCFFPATADYFYRSSKTKDGFKCWCKKCAAESAGREYYWPAKEGYKRCARCKAELPATTEFFYRKRNTPDGFYAYCKGCRAERRGAIRRTRKVYKNTPKVAGNAVCIRCGEEYPQTTDYFFRDSRSESGYHSYCKWCTAKSQGYEYQDSRRKAKLTPDGYKYCPSCDEYLPATTDHFVPDEKGTHGLYCYCRPCQRKKANEYAKTPEGKAKKQNRGRRRRARIRGLSADWTIEDETFALRYWNNQCAICGRPLNGMWHTASFDHWIPIASGGGTIPTNMVPLCSGWDGCNQAKGAIPAAEFLRAKLGPKKAKVKMTEVRTFFKQVRQTETD